MAALLEAASAAVGSAVAGGSATAVDPGFALPDWYDFPPAFTLQPVEQTQQRQLAMWHQLVLQWAAHHRTWRMVPDKWPLFSNERIGRRLPKEGVDAVVASLVRSGARTKRASRRDDPSSIAPPPRAGRRD